MNTFYFVLGVVSILAIIAFVVSVVVTFMIVSKYLKLKDFVKEKINAFNSDIDSFNQSIIKEFEMIRTENNNDHENTIDITDKLQNNITLLDDDIRKYIDSRLDKLENKIINKK